MRTARADIEQRRHQAAQLWLRGVSVRQIAQALKVHVDTISNDLAAIRQELVAEHRHDLESARARALAVLHQVEREAWTTYAKLDERSVNKSAMLNVVLSAEKEMNRILGVTGPEAAAPQVSNMQVVFMLPEPDAAPHLSMDRGSARAEGTVVNAFPDFPMVDEADHAQ
jgi:DNA-binding CsgD family transcriptional regulator